jgi:CheY-like chemotaxis protein
MSDKIPVLVAEDEAMMRIIAVEVLADAGFQVFEASDGVEALELLQTNPQIALLVSDIKMPRMDGYALVEAGLALRPDLKVLLMTGYGGEPPGRIAELREIQILHKPFNLDRLSTLAAEMTA